MQITHSKCFFHLLCISVGDLLLKFFVLCKYCCFGFFHDFILSISNKLKEIYVLNLCLTKKKTKS